MKEYSLALLIACSPMEEATPDAGVVDPPECPGLTDKVASLKTRFEQTLASNHVQGGALAIVCGGQVRAVGVGTIKMGGAPVTATTRFQMASITKMLTATTALSLQQDGVIDLLAPVSRIVPSLAYGQITLDQILSHSSGLPIRFPNENVNGLHAWLVDSQNAAAALWAPPGAVWYYNNEGYSVAGGLLEQAAQRPFPSLVQERALTAFGLSHATMLVDDVIAHGDYAYGHSGETGTSVLAPNDSYYGDPIYAPMGGAWASADDIGAFVLALLGRGDHASLLEPAKAKHIRTGDFPELYYGYGLEIDEGMSPTIIGHSGSVQGFLSDLETVPSAGVGVAVMVNSDWYFPNDISRAALASLVTVTETRPPSPEPDTRWPQLVGSYRSSELGRIDVSIVASHLQARFVDKNVTKDLEFQGYDTYYFEWDDPVEGTIPAQVSFWVDGTSPATYFVSDVGVGARI